MKLEKLSTSKLEMFKSSEVTSLFQIRGGVKEATKGPDCWDRGTGKNGYDPKGDKGDISPDDIKWGNCIGTGVSVGGDTSAPVGAGVYATMPNNPASSSQVGYMPVTVYRY